MKFRDYITEANIETSLKNRIEKVSSRGGKLAITKWKLIDEVAKIQKKMKLHGIEEIPYGPGLILRTEDEEEAMDIVRNWMA